MICSLNEIEALSRKAGRGAGLSWGLAEEAGKAVRWLCQHGFPGPRLLAELLGMNDAKPYADLAPERVNGVWVARSGMLCPIIAGALLCDRATDLKAGTVLRLGEVAVPLLLAPFASEASRLAGVTVALDWDGASLGLDGGAPGITGDPEALCRPSAPAATVARSDRAVSGAVSGAVRTEAGRHVTPETLAKLEGFAQRTYAPATDASRAGAGAGRDDP